jgi:hypothetical protein
MLQEARGGRKDEVGRRRAEHDEIDLARLDAGGFKRVRRGIEREITRGLAIGRATALADARARRDPLVRRFDDLFEIGVGDDLFRQIAAGAGDA